MQKNAENMQTYANIRKDAKEYAKLFIEYAQNM